MFSDPYDAHVDTAGAALTKPFDIVNIDGSNTVRSNAGRSNGHAAVIRISHTKVGGKSTGVRNRHLVSVEAYQLDEAGDEALSLPMIKFQFVADIPITQEIDLSGTLGNIAEQFTGLIRGNSVNDTIAVDKAEFLEPFLNGQS
jgi:hypothetical protein